jgi:hypothetical protein
MGLHGMDGWGMVWDGIEWLRDGVGMVWYGMGCDGIGWYGQLWDGHIGLDGLSVLRNCD